jgi:hypothetical protein
MNISDLVLLPSLDDVDLAQQYLDSIGSVKFDKEEQEFYDAVEQILDADWYTVDKMMAVPYEQVSDNYLVSKGESLSGWVLEDSEIVPIPFNLHKFSPEKGFHV